MLIQHEEQASLNAFFQTIKLQNHKNESGKEKAAKIEQILAYLEAMHAQLRQYSRKRDLILIESGAGNCYLSFLVYYFYTKFNHRPVTIHCLDINARLMEKAQQLARTLRFDRMHFHACDIAEYRHSGRVDMVYSLRVSKKITLSLDNLKCSAIFSGST